MLQTATPSLSNVHQQHMWQDERIFHKLANFCNQIIIVQLHADHYMTISCFE